MLNFIKALIIAFVYRLKGGGFIKLNDTLVRLLFGAVLATMFYLDHLYVGQQLLYATLLIFLLAFAAQTIGHSSYQAMGHGPLPQWSLVAGFLPQYTNAEWLAMSQTARTINDMIGMSMIGFYRGIITYALPWLVLNHEHFYFINLWKMLGVVGLLMLWHPFGYLLGYYVPFSLGSSLKEQKNFQGTDWSELIVGFGWYLSEKLLIV